MRRRTFLTTLGTSAGAGIYTVSGCTARRSPVTRSSTLHPPAPPSSTAIPIDFGTEQIWPPPEVAAALLPADAGAAEVADGAEEALPEPAERGLPALPEAAGSADCAEVCPGAAAGLGS